MAHCRFDDEFIVTVIAITTIIIIIIIITIIAIHDCRLAKIMHTEREKRRRACACV